jgi:hypothetical protein
MGSGGEEMQSGDGILGMAWVIKEAGIVELGRRFSRLH